MGNTFNTGDKVCLQSNQDCRMTIGADLGGNFFDCVWLNQNKELQVAKLHASMLVPAPELREIGFKQTNDKIKWL